jgi:hypothetical protein
MDAGKSQKVGVVAVQYGIMAVMFVRYPGGSFQEMPLHPNRPAKH